MKAIDRIKAIAPQMQPGGGSLETTAACQALYLTCLAQQQEIDDLKRAVRYMASHMLWAKEELTGDEAQQERAEMIARGFPLDEITLPTGDREAIEGDE